MNKGFLTEGRCRLLARTLMDLVKIFMAAMFASEFFLKFDWSVRVGVALATLALFGLALWFQPSEEGGKDPSCL